MYRVKVVAYIEVSTDKQDIASRWLRLRTAPRAWDAGGLKKSQTLHDSVFERARTATADRASTLSLVQSKRQSTTTALSRDLRGLLPVLAGLTSWLTDQVAHGAAPGSALAIEIDEERQRQGADAKALLSAATSEAITALTWSACGHLDGLRRLLGAKDEVPHPHALVSLARAAIENAALAAWLADSSVNGDERSRRFVSYQHHGLTEFAKLGVGTDVDLDSASLDAIVESRGWKLAVPAKTQLVADLFLDRKMDPGDALGAFCYRVHSAIAHGSFHTMQEFFHSVGDEGGVVGATGQQAFSMCILPSVLAVQLLGYQLVATFGLSTDGWAEMIRLCGAVDVRHLISTKP